MLTAILTVILCLGLQGSSLAARTAFALGHHFRAGGGPGKMNQSYTKGFSVVLEEKTGNDAVVKVNLWGPKNVKPFTVNLKKQKEGWRINAIICPGVKYSIK